MLLAAICICSNVKAEITPDKYAVLAVKDVELKAGEVKEMELNLKNPIPVSAITTDIILPEGCTFEPYGRRHVQMTERISDTHMASTNLLEGNHLRIVMVSLEALDVAGNDGAIIKFKINVGKDVKPGEYKIQLAGQQVVTADEQKANDWNSTTTSTLTIKPNEFTVTIKDAVNGTVTGAGSYPAGSEVTLTAAANEGYKFVKWSNEIIDNPYKFNITEDVELSAIFEACKYTITYVVDGETYKTVEVAFGSKITPETAPSKEGYKFSGWSELPETMPAKDITVTGTFASNVYTITYVVDGETYKTVKVAFGSKITPETAPEKEGYKFSGWSEMPETMPAKDVTVTGSFIANVYTITYVVDGETYKTVEVAFGEKITPEAIPAKEGYKFSGWSEMPETMPAKDVTVTGTFEIIIAVNEIISSDKKVDVYNQNGIRIYKQVYVKEALQRLPKGIYFINGQKIYKQ